MSWHELEAELDEDEDEEEEEQDELVEELHADVSEVDFEAVATAAGPVAAAAFDLADRTRRLFSLPFPVLTTSQVTISMCAGVLEEAGFFIFC